MKIEDVRIDGQVMTKTGRIGRVAGACDNGRVYVLFGSEKFSQNLSVCDIEPIARELRVGDKVQATGRSVTFHENVDGKVGVIKALSTSVGGIPYADVRYEEGGGNCIALTQLTKIDACESCEMAPVITRQCKQIAELEHEKLAAFWEGKAVGCKESEEKIAELQITVDHEKGIAFWRGRDSLSAEIKRIEEECDQWQTTAQNNIRNAAYWRKELDKLQKETLAEDMRIADAYQEGRKDERLVQKERAKLQKESMAECNEHIHPAIYIEDFRKKPLGKVTKIYIQISPDVLARIISEREE